MRYEDNELVRLSREVKAYGLGDDYPYVIPAGVLGTVVTPGDDGCQAEFEIELLDGGYEYAIASLDAASADPVPRSEWPSLARTREAAGSETAPIIGAA